MDASKKRKKRIFVIALAFLSLGLIAGALFVFREQLFPNLVPDAENRAVSSDEAEVSVADIVVDTQAATGAFAKGDASTGNQLIDEKIESSDSNSDKASLELRRAELLQGVGDFDGAVDAALRAESLYGDATERYFAYLHLRICTSFYKTMMLQSSITRKLLHKSNRVV